MADKIIKNLSLEEIADRLSQLSYRPGWSFEVYTGAYEGDQLVIWTRVEDSYNPGKFVELDVHVPLPPFETTDQFDEWLLWRLKKLEIHEAMEWLHGSDGKPLFDPHRPHADRDLKI